MKVLVAAIAGAMLVAAGEVVAQSSRSADGAKPSARSTATTPGIITGQGAGQFLVRDLLGTTVVTQDGKRVGEIKDLILDPRGMLAGVVVLSGSFLGIGGKSVGISSDRVRIESAARIGDGERQMVLVRLTMQEISEAPEFRSVSDMQNTRSGN